MHHDIDTRSEAIWIALVSAAAILGSLAFACATPFAAIATIAATRMRARAGSATVLLAWAANQAIGYGLRGYPQTWNSYGWGLAIGIAAVAALVAARLAARTGAGTPVRLVLAFATAFLCYEAVLLAATVPLASGASAFTVRTVLRIAEINAFALLGLLALHRAALAIGLPVPIMPARAGIYSGDAIC